MGFVRIGVIALVVGLAGPLPAVAQGMEDGIRAFSALSTGNWGLAQFYATRALESHTLKLGDEAGVFAYRGEARRHLNDFAGAVVDYTEAIGRGVSGAFAARVFNGRGIALFAQEELDLAVADYTQAIKLDPKFVEALDNRGVVYMAGGELRRAIDDFTAAAALAPTNPIPLNNRGRAYLEVQFCEEAYQDFTAALDLNPADPVTPLFNRGIAAECLNRPDDAFDDFAAAFDLAPDEPNYREKFQEYGLMP